jgi:hypothetical protein
MMRNFGLQKTIRINIMTPMQIKIIEANVICKNNQHLGYIDIKVQFLGGKPIEVFHDGNIYTFTGRERTEMPTPDGRTYALNGRTVNVKMPTMREMATSGNDRFWISLNGTAVFKPLEN